MGISADQFWQSSANGKAMVNMLARRGDVEIVRDVCDWLVGMYGKDLIAGAVQQGATMEQARVASQNNTAGLQSSVDSINDRNVLAVSMGIVDAVFQRHYNAGKPAYDKVMAQFAAELRQRVTD